MVIVDVYHEPNGETPDVSINLLKNGKDYPTFSSFKFVEPKPLTTARRVGLSKDVYSVLVRNRVKMTQEAHDWWNNEVLSDPTT